MINIAIVEDTESDSDMLVFYLNQWGESIGEQLYISTYCCALDFLTNLKNQFDLIFLDIKMPDKNGIDVAKTIRKNDDNVIIVFTTTMKQYALNGYEVDALDFILKPISYERFCALMRKCLGRLAKNKTDSKFIAIHVPDGTFQIDINSIVFVESLGHNVIYHLVNGQTLKKRSTLNEEEKQLPEIQFARCNVSYLVNLKFVQKIEGEYVKIYGGALKITRSRNSEFRKAFVNYFSNTEVDDD